MEIRGRKAIEQALRKHAAMRKPMKQWLEIVQAAQWQSIIEARAVCPTADAVKGTPFTCFNIGGNSFRLIAIVSYQRQDIVVDEVLTHAEYAKKYG